MPSYESLRNSRDFRRVLSIGTRRRKGGITVISSPGPHDFPRLGLVVSKSCGSSVRRNRIKRRLRAAAASVGLENGKDYVIIATAQIADTPFELLEDWLKSAKEDPSDA